MSSKNCMPKAGDSTDAILDHDRIEVEEHTEDELETRENSIGRGILQHKKNRSRKSTIEVVKDPKYKCCGNKMRIFLSTLLVLTVFIGLGVSCLFRNPTLLVYPLHASCNVTWTFSKPCDEIRTKLLDQIEAWKGDDICGEGQKCLYALVEDEENGKLKATHTTPVRKYIDDLEFNFYTNTVTNGCNLIGFSTSRVWYAVLDYGTNYCNIHNLVSGAGLQDDEHYSELTRDEVCTQYTSSNCEKY